VAEEQPSAEKTEPPSQRKIREAKKRGNVPKSKDVATVLVLAGVAALVFLGARSAADQLGALFALAVDAAPRGREGWLWVLSRHTVVAAQLIGVVVGLALLLAIVAMLLQTGFSISMEPVKPQLSRVNPIQGLKRLFQLRKLVEIAKSTLLLAIVAVAVFLILRRRIDDLAHLPVAHPGAVLNLGINLGLGLMVAVVPLFALVAAFDLGFQRFVWHKDLRMTKHETKRESKDSEGDPIAKSRRRRDAAEFMEPAALENLAHATLVLHSATGQLVAMQYAPETGAELPLVLLKAQGEIAAEALSRATRDGVRIMQDDALVGELFPSAQVLQYIPAKVAAEVARLFKS